VDVSTFDPLTYAMVIVCLLLVSFVAVLVPAIRAPHMDPAEALRGG